jgi:hypothetical protein
MIWKTVLRPLHGCRKERLLHRVFGSGEIMKTAYDRAQHLRRQLPQYLLGNFQCFFPNLNAAHMSYAFGTAEVTFRVLTEQRLA